MVRRRESALKWSASVALLTFGIAVAVPSAALPLVDERELLGESFEGRPIRVFHRGDPEEIRVLVVGCIHGDECAGLRIARRLRTGRPRGFVDLWVLPNLNPDGRAAHTRQNARGVDLNRNFPFRWEPAPPGRYYPGRRPRVRAGDADRDAPDPPDRTRHHDLVPPAARAGRCLG